MWYFITGAILGAIAFVIWYVNTEYLDDYDTWGVFVTLVVSLLVMAIGWPLVVVLCAVYLIAKKLRDVVEHRRTGL